MGGVAAFFFVIVIVAAGGALAEAQAPVRAVPAVHITVMPEPVTPNRRNDPKAVVERILSFDADGDDRVTADELPERMQAVLERADRNGDGFLTAGEVLPPAGPTVPMTGGASVRVNRSSLADVVNDLKLPRPVHDRAMAIVTKHRVPRNVNDSDSIALHAAMKELLDEEDFGNFAAAVARLRFNSLTVRTIVRPGGPAGSTPTP